MKLTFQPLALGSPVKFTLQGFPEESAVRVSLENFYANHPEAERSFLIFNTFAEQIFSGQVDKKGALENLTPSPRPVKL